MRELTFSLFWFVKSLDGLWGKIKGYFRKNLLKSVGIDTISFLFSFYFVCNFVINGVKVLGKV